MEDRLKELMQALGNAINDSLSDSDRIAEAIGEIKHAGYNVFMVLEATIGFHKREPDGDEPRADETTGNASPPSEQTFVEGGRIKYTAHDHRFLRALKIAVDDENDSTST